VDSRYRILNFSLKLHPMGVRFALRSLILVPVLAATSAIAQQAEATGTIEVIDRIVAVVNESVVTRQELNESLRTAIKQLQKQGVQPPPPTVLEKQLLERMILNQVQLQLAKETGLKVSDTELDQTHCPGKPDVPARVSFSGRAGWHQLQQVSR
jgi:peptidyl-prolyl cis-trans isomerase SurA